MYAKEIAVAVAAVNAAGRVCRAVRTDLVNSDTTTKQDRSPVTVADFASQAVICRALKEAFPGDPVVAEEDAAWLRGEDGRALRDTVREHAALAVPGWSGSAMLDAIDHGCARGGATGRFWALDPIDGTKGFIRGDQYAIALALIEDGQPVVGILGCPSLPMRGVGIDVGGCVLAASHNGGTRMVAMGADDWTAVRVCDAGRASDTVLCEPFEKGHTAQGTSARIAERLSVRGAPVRLDSQAKYAVVARGEAGAYLRLPTRPGYEEKIWDHAAGYVVVTAAGGVVTDVTGKALDFSRGRTLSANKGVVVAAASLHTEVLAAVRAELGS